MFNEKMGRKEALKKMALGSAVFMAAGVSACSPQQKDENENEKKNMALKGNIKHSTCRWCYSSIPLDELCAAGKEIGLGSIELLNPDEWPVAAKHGLTCAITNGSSLGIENGFNDPANHARLLQDYTELFPKVAEAGLKNVICFSGNRRGLSDAQGLENCAVGLEPVVKLAQQYNLTLVMELLNSRVNHPDYQCDHTEWGVALCEKVGSDSFKLLYDIYHMQIMEGDIIATIKKYHPYIAHYHTGGVPGRNEIDESQELYYPAIMRAILETGYQGFVAQEFIPKGPQPLESLRAAVLICDV
jgi:hydroxypyruvate isomerase